MERSDQVKRNIAVARRFVEQVYNQHNVDALDDLVADDFVFSGLRGETSDLARLKKVYRHLFEQMHASFPDMTFEIADVVADEQGVSLRLIERGTFEKPFRGMEPTGEEIEVEAIEIFMIEEGRIVRRHAVRDSAAVQRQVGQPAQAT